MKRLWIKTLIFCVCSVVVMAVPAQESAENTNITETNYQDWLVRCEQIEGTGERCVMTQLAQLEETGEWLMQANIAYIPERAEPIMSIILPLGVALPEGVKLQLGEADENANVLSFSHCEPGGCYVNQLLAEEAIQRITAVESGSVTFATIQGEAIEVPFSPQGFAEALAALRE